MAIVFTELDPESGRVVPSRRADQVVIDEDGRCHLCGARVASGVWYGERRTLQVCQPCALGVLPSLIADAVVGHVFEVQARTRDRFTIPDPTYHLDLARDIQARFAAAYLEAAREAEEVPPTPGVGVSIGPAGRRGY